MNAGNNHRRKFLKTITGAVGGAAIFNGVPLDAYSKSPSATNGINYTFLFQGDSITDGNRTRDNDWNHVMGHGYAYLIASRLWYDQPAKKFHFFNRGISGNKVSDLEKRWDADTIVLRPDLVSILVGVNDVAAEVSQNTGINATKFEEGYRNILNSTKAKLPSAQIVICEPFILPVGYVNNNWELWQDKMKTKQAVTRQLAKEFNAIYVPLQESFSKACEKAAASYWIWDGVHPMPAGHELIARKWISVVKNELSFIV